MTDNLWLWIGFNVFVLCMLALDLGVFHRKAHVRDLQGVDRLDRRLDFLLAFHDHLDAVRMRNAPKT